MEDKTIDENKFGRSKKYNNFTINGEFAELDILNRNCEKVAITIIDIEDMDKVKDYSWGLITGNYVFCSRNKILLHRLIMDCPEGMVIDHINHDPLDNRKSNLRICTFQENSCNKTKRKENGSGHIGIFWHGQHKKWYAQIMFKGKIHFLGIFKVLEDAIKARKEGEIKYFGYNTNQ